MPLLFELVFSLGTLLYDIKAPPEFVIHPGHYFKQCSGSRGKICCHILDITVDGI